MLQPAAAQEPAPPRRLQQSTETIAGISVVYTDMPAHTDGYIIPSNRFSGNLFFTFLLFIRYRAVKQLFHFL